MNIDTHHITVSKQAKYVTYGKLNSSTKYFWFALHGSHMICEQMIYKFSNFDPDTHFILAPEGLSRQYAKGYSGKVVATWMTSRDRIFEIEDFSNYLSSLYNLYLEKLPTNCQKILLGFSQGGTTLLRWLHQNNIDFDTLIAYSCSIPKDIDLFHSKSLLNNNQLLYTYGLKDEFITSSTIKVIKSIINQNQLKMKYLPYDGNHKIDKDQLQTIFTDYINEGI